MSDICVQNNHLLRQIGGKVGFVDDSHWHVGINERLTLQFFPASIKVFKVSRRTGYAIVMINAVRYAKNILDLRLILTEELAGQTHVCR